MGETNILPELKAMGYEDDEIFPALYSVIEGSNYSKTLNHITMLGSKNEQIHLILSKNPEIDGSRFLKILIENEIWSRTKELLSQDLETSSSNVVKTYLLHRGFQGYICIENWIQVRPVWTKEEISHYQTHANDPFAFGSPPLIVETYYKTSNFGLLDKRRRLKATNEAVWLLNAFLDFPFRRSVNRYVWVGEEQEFSDNEKLNGKTLTVPELESLYVKFTRLNDKYRKQFTRSCAYLFAATDPNGDYSTRILAYVNAIESLLDGKTQRHRKFKAFVDEFAQSTEELKHDYDIIYQWRNEIAHGAWHEEVDAIFLRVDEYRGVTSFLNNNTAKKGIITWLLAQP